MSERENFTPFHKPLNKMKHLYLFLISLAIACLISCAKKDGYVLIDTRIDVRVVNSSGEDLLNAPRIFDKTSFKFTSISDKETKLQLSLFEETKTNINSLAIYCHNDVGTNSNVAVLQVGSTKPDTIRCEFYRNKGYFTCTKVWLNGEVKYDKTNNLYGSTAAREITLVK